MQIRLFYVAKSCRQRTWASVAGAAVAASDRALPWVSDAGRDDPAAVAAASCGQPPAVRLLASKVLAAVRSMGEIAVAGKISRAGGFRLGGWQGREQPG